MQSILRHVAASAFTALIATLLAAPATVRAQAPTIERIDIFDVGLYCSETIERRREPNAPGGYVNIVADSRLVKRTTEVPLQIGTRFGLRYTISGPPGASVALRTVTRMPPPGIRDPETGKIMLVSDYPIPARVGVTGFQGVHIEFDWELLPGVWKFEYWDGNRKLAEQEFTLTTPKNPHGNPCAPVVGGISAPKTPGKNTAMRAYSAAFRPEPRP